MSNRLYSVMTEARRYGPYYVVAEDVLQASLKVEKLERGDKLAITTVRVTSVQEISDRVIL